jgi:hypothetical protein
VFAPVKLLQFNAMFAIVTITNSLLPQPLVDQPVKIARAKHSSLFRCSSVGDEENEFCNICIRPEKERRELSKTKTKGW